MKTRTVRRRRLALAPNRNGTENPAMARRAQEKEWRLTDRYERRIPRRLRSAGAEEWDE